MSFTRRLRTGLAAGMIMLCGIAFASVALSQTTPAKLPEDCSSYASVPLPAEAERLPVPKTPPACASYRSYRGIGRPVNYTEARACAWQERLAQKAELGQNMAEPTAWVVGGSLILADIYFNGAGVERDIPLAMRFACEAEERMAMLALPDIVKLNDAPHPHGPFEFCDYAATTFSMNFCGDYASEVEDERRSRYYNSLKPSMTPQQKAAFEKLLAAQSAYIDAHADEVYQGGTIRAIRIMTSQKILKDLFRAEIAQCERKQWPSFSDDQVKTADGLLRHQYQTTLKQLRKHTKDDIAVGEVTAESLSRVEATWEKYRDAWVTFARLRYPFQVPTIRTEITMDRYRLLRTM